MNNLQFGDIVLVKFHPSSGAELKKYRPAVLINSLEDIDSRFATIAPFTTNLKSPQKNELLIANHQALKKDSLLLCWYLQTIDQRRLVKKLGKLHKKEQKQLQLELKKLFVPGEGFEPT